jgi:tRNA (mo5U34)-methyltransferase
MSASATDRAALLEQARSRTWYHTLDLGDGLVTDGWFDLREDVRHYQLPADMTGMRALEVGTWDGFWAFEMERRGATVVAIDLDDERELDWPPRRRPATYPDEPRGEGFRLAKTILASNVERVSCNVYDATPERLGGTFDLVFCGSVLIHLRDQMLALERIAGLCDDLFIFAEEYDRSAELVPFPVSRYFADRDKAVVYFMPALKTWKRMLWTAGFDRVEQISKFKMQARDYTVPHAVLHGHKQ